MPMRSRDRRIWAISGTFTTTSLISSTPSERALKRSLASPGGLGLARRALYDRPLGDGASERRRRDMADPFPRRGRDLRLDFFRGLSLFFIFIDHIPNNFLGWFTLHSIAFSDAAEVFIFISGYTAALVYGRSLRQHGAFFATAQIYRRVWQLYVAHIFLFMIFTAEVSYTILTVNNPMYAEEMRVADFLQEPHIAVLKALTLQFQPTFLDILPLYIVLL